MAIRVDFHPDEFLADVEARFRASAEDVRQEAARRSRSSQIAASGRVEQVTPGVLRVIFDAAFAKARERGAYIRPRRGRRGRSGRPAVLRFEDGTFRPFARLRRHPYLEPAGRLWGDILLARLRGSGIGARRRR